MRKVSSITTSFRKKILPVIILINLIGCIISSMFFSVEFENLLIIFFPSIIFAGAWIFSFRKLQTVYLSDSYLFVRNKKIYFRNIVSIEKISFFKYRVTYKINDKINSFVFMVDSLPFITPDFIKIINANVEVKE